MKLNLKFTLRTMLVVTVLAAVLLVVADQFLKPATVSPIVPLDIFARSGGSQLNGESDTHSFRLDLKANDFLEVPKWRRRESNPPVPVNEAMILAQKYRDSLVIAKQFPAGSQITSSQLVPFDLDEGDWIWVITFTCVQVGNPIEEIEVAVLMDGTVAKPGVRRRVDTGWPPPDQVVVPHGSLLTDEELVAEFVSKLNADRSFAGQTVRLRGRLSLIPEGHEHRSTGLYRHFDTSDGITLLFWFPHGVPRSKLEGEIEISGKLLGFRDLSDRSESWEGLRLYPGIRPSSVGRPSK